MRRWVWQHLNGTSGEFLSSSLNRWQKEDGSGSTGGSSTGSADSSSHLLDMDEEPPQVTEDLSYRSRWRFPVFPFHFLRSPFAAHHAWSLGVGNRKTNRDCSANMKTLHISQDKTHGWKDGRSMFIKFNPMVNIGGAWEAPELGAY